MKTVFSNGMCAHVWAQRSQPHGRSNSMHFDGSVLYSYQTPIANFAPNKRGQCIPLFTSHTYSMTTSSEHVAPARRAVRYEGFTVPDVGAQGGRATSAIAGPASAWKSWKPVHKVNVAYLESQVGLAASRELKRTKWGPENDYGATVISAAHKILADYCIAFDQKMPRIDMPALVAAIRAKRDRLDNDPKRKERNEKAQARRDERERAEGILRASHQSENLAAWLRGEINGTYDLPQDGHARLRVNGDVVETSWGANVPIEEARALLRFVHRVREHGIIWTNERESFSIGAFHVNAIAGNGDLTIGCHSIKWESVEAIIPQLNAGEVQS